MKEQLQRQKHIKNSRNHLHLRRRPIATLSERLQLLGVKPKRLHGEWMMLEPSCEKKRRQEDMQIQTTEPIGAMIEEKGDTNGPNVGSDHSQHTYVTHVTLGEGESFAAQLRQNDSEQ
ncbi:hypothetical protein VNO77_01739 [Canavalia gladiata]|uniref:Uncharacterized protein n=1 Tax=Canavalia gladiata TaxID=3824 RepID=A0AAN9MRY9_CANGL